MKVRRCEHCGAPAPSAARCGYCGNAVTVGDDLIAVDFGTAPTTWEVTPPVELVTIEQPDARSLVIDLPPNSAVRGPTMPCAWTRGSFVDVDASVAIGFDAPSEGSGAGFWLRSSDAGFLAVTRWHNGAITVHVRQDQREDLGTIYPATVHGGLAVLRVRLVGERLTVYVDGVPAGEVRAPFTRSGTVDLFAQTALHQRSRVRFVDALARLP